MKVWSITLDDTWDDQWLFLLIEHAKQTAEDSWWKYVEEMQELPPASQGLEEPDWKEFKRADLHWVEEKDGFPVKVDDAPKQFRLHMGTVVTSYILKEEKVFAEAVII